MYTRVLEMHNNIIMCEINTVVLIDRILITTDEYNYYMCHVLN